MQVLPECSRPLVVWSYGVPRSSDGPSLNRLLMGRPSMAVRRRARLGVEVGVENLTFFFSNDSSLGRPPSRARAMGPRPITRNSVDAHKQAVDDRIDYLGDGAWDVCIY